jgi:hypothetical protein
LPTLRCTHRWPGSPGAELYPDFVDKAAVLIVRLAKNHPLPDGNKRAAWASLRVFVALNGWTIEPYPSVDEAEAAVLVIAAGDWDQRATASWLRPILRPPHPSEHGSPDDPSARQSRPVRASRAMSDLSDRLQPTAPPLTRTFLVELLRRYANLGHLRTQLAKALVIDQIRPPEHRVSPPPIRVRLPRSLHAELIEAYTSGATTCRVAQTYGCSKSAVEHILHRSGTPMRNQPLTPD